MKGKILIFLIFFAIFGSGVVLWLRSTDSTNLQPAPSIKTNAFDITSLKVGDRVAGMTVKSIGSYSEKQEFSESNAKVVFEGKTEVAGKYFYSGPPGGEYTDVCMSDFDEESLFRLPRARTETRTTWFCFTNSEVAFKEFAPVGSTGEVKVLIDKYTVNDFPSEVWNTAELVEVKK